MISNNSQADLFTQSSNSIDKTNKSSPISGSLELARVNSNGLINGFKDLNGVELGSRKYSTLPTTLTWKNVRVLPKKSTNIFSKLKKSSYKVKQEKDIISNGKFFLFKF